MIVTCRQNINGQTDRLINRGAEKWMKFLKPATMQTSPNLARPVLRVGARLVAAMRSSPVVDECLIILDYLNDRYWH